jgi:hypothetical protein
MLGSVIISVVIMIRDDMRPVFFVVKICRMRHVMEAFALAVWHWDSSVGAVKVWDGGAICAARIWILRGRCVRSA